MVAPLSPSTTPLPAPPERPTATAHPFYTTRDLQGFLGVDRTTIYRMAESGRLPAVKVGAQWRFPRRTIDQWLATHANLQSPTVIPAQASVAAAPAPALNDFPVECVQILQDTFAEALGAMVIVTDLQGRPLTEPSNAPGLVQCIQTHPQAHERCLQWWADLARRPSLHPTFLPSQLGLLCTRGFVRRGHELVGMVIVGGIAPAAWPPAAEELTQIAAWLGLRAPDLEPHLGEVYRLDAGSEQRLLALVQRIADVITHILDERARLLGA